MQKNLSAYFSDKNHTLSSETEYLIQIRPLTVVYKPWNASLYGGPHMKGQTALYITEVLINTLTYQVSVMLARKSLLDGTTW